ncbi:MBL fold metallo-hydrolase [Paenirhodobacter sp. CAU 1674]|uniref:MBL fold metallo-hydrolase n=1 Tax=Paenirhodobacter sp. CAU 1674 TaxID=3032596 RepID=UPI0023DB379E|nr:MBL fold metallo-hydrolase [Paenirhodobacter sp. CAU 1674]MDF2142534.1 MBL fold metallo-hydrolase [Paenirhodobacter sp. CAU 1674]
MIFTRRTILRMGAAAGATALLPLRSFAAQTMTLGSATLDTLSDGNLVLPMGFVTDHPGAAEVMARYGITGPQVEPPCNVTLYRDGTNTVLFDVGAGPDFMPTAGKLHEALDALGVSADEITHVVFTHAHPDHLWGVLDEFDEPIFANAQHMMGKAEWDFWIDPETQNTIDEGRKTFAAGALRRMSMLEDRIVTFGDGEEILPGVGARASHGHTPGHMAFEVRQGNSACMVVGDAIGNNHLAFAEPLWASGSDQDAEMGAQTRLGLLNQLADAQMPMIGYHLPEGGIGRVERDGAAFRFATEV